MTIPEVVLCVVAAAFCGAVVVIVGYFAYRTAKWIKTAVQDLCSGFTAMGHLAEQNQKLVEVAMMVATELQMLRSAIGNQAPGNPEQPSEGTSHPPTPPAPFPQWNPNVFVPVTHEAEIDDTVIDDTDDARMVKLERVEELRTMGVEVDPEELEEG